MFYVVEGWGERKLLSGGLVYWSEKFLGPQNPLPTVGNLGYTMELQAFTAWRGSKKTLAGRAAGITRSRSQKSTEKYC